MIEQASRTDSLTEFNDTSQPRTFIVLNPAAGTTDADTAQKTVEEKLSRNGVDFEIYLTRKEDNIAEIVSRALEAGYTRVAAIGGDGTIALVAAALVNRDVPLGIIPAGSGNLLARAFSIPLDLSEALDVLLDSPRILTIDAMQVEDRPFFLNVSAGFTSLTLQRTRKQDKRRLGMLAYFWRGLEQLRRLRTHSFQMTIDGEELRLRASEVLLANAGFLGINPYTVLEREIKPDDGAVDVCMLYAGKARYLPALILEQLTGRETPFPTLECKPARREVHLASLRPLPLQGDGELIGHTPAVIKIVPRALKVIVPDTK